MVELLVCIRHAKGHGVSHEFKIVRIIIPARLIKQSNGTLSRMYVQTYIRVTCSVAVSTMRSLERI